MVLPDGAIGWAVRNPCNASLDRVDHAVGYLKGNVRFVTFMANVARSNFSDSELLGFCKAVANVNPKNLTDCKIGT